MTNLFVFLQKTMEEPQPFGTFHWIAIAATVAVTLFLCLFFRNAGEKGYRRILIVIWAVMVLFEVVAELVLSFAAYDDGTVTWTYHLSFFPLQLCDTPLYLLLPIAFLKDGKVRDALSAYMCSYILLGGLIAYGFASTIFGANIFLNVRTLIHHGLQIAVCIFIGVRNRRRFSLRTFLSAMIVFVISVAFITAFNVGMHAIYPEEYINMFYISPYHRRTVPVLNEAFQSIHWSVVILLYLTVVSVLAFVIYLVYRLIVRLVSPRAEKKG